MYKTILVLLENSPADATIIEHVQPLARLTGGRLILLHVAEGHAARNQDQLDLEDSEEIRLDRAYLAQRQAELAQAGFQVTALLVRGEPSHEILAVAEREKCDLIAMATHGHGFVMDLLLGSVANAVRHRASVPVLMLRAQTT